jgi:DNA ligase-associated metallophosphoesterase
VNKRVAEFRVNGARLIGDMSGAVYWPAAGALIVADLHLEKGSAYATRGVALPPYDTAETLNRLEACLERYAPRLLVSLGDSFHDTRWQERMAAADAARLVSLTRQLRTVWVLGNHDPTPPPGLAGEAYDSFDMRADGSLHFRHEPMARDATTFIRGEVAGHLHPCARVRQRGRVLRRRCFVEDTTRLVLPAFGALTGSLNVLDPAFDEVFAAGHFNAWMIGKTTIAGLSAHQLSPDRG